MSVEAITDIIHDYMYEKINESRDSEEETKIKHVDRKKYYQKPEKEKPNKFRKVDCIRCGAPNWCKQHDCSAKTKKCLNYGKTGHYAKLCRTKQKSARKMKHIYPESEATSAEEDDWSPNKRHFITITVHSTKQTTRDGQPFFTTAALVNNCPIKFIIDSGSPVTLLTKQMFNKITPTQPLHMEYREVNNNKIKIEGKTTAKVETNGETKKPRTANNNKKNKPIARAGLDELFGNQTRNREN